MKVRIEDNTVLYPTEYHAEFYDFHYDLAELMQKYGVTCFYNNWSRKGQGSVTLIHDVLYIKRMVYRMKARVTE